MHSWRNQASKRRNRSEKCFFLLLSNVKFYFTWVYVISWLNNKNSLNIPNEKAQWQRFAHNTGLWAFSPSFSLQVFSRKHRKMYILCKNDVVCLKFQSNCLKKTVYRYSFFSPSQLSVWVGIRFLHIALTRNIGGREQISQFCRAWNSLSAGI